MVDEFTRECLLRPVDRSVKASDVVAALADMIDNCGIPGMIRCDSGPEVMSRALNEFCTHEIVIGFIPPA